MPNLYLLTLRYTRSEPISGAFTLFLRHSTFQDGVMQISLDNLQQSFNFLKHFFHPTQPKKKKFELDDCQSKIFQNKVFFEEFLRWEVGRWPTADRDENNPIQECG